ncbi:Uncharacterised protein [Kingella potus]|uniref:Uncharacterized protein n=1 Tax=Kingella potus TaxID=265175 RepID=A0A377R4E7_9NEIS|nr:Uncharacterised protein [Kingella potus]
MHHSNGGKRIGLCRLPAHGGCLCQARPPPLPRRRECPQAGRRQAVFAVIAKYRGRYVCAAMGDCGGFGTWPEFRPVRMFVLSPLRRKPHPHSHPQVWQRPPACGLPRVCRHICGGGGLVWHISNARTARRQTRFQTASCRRFGYFISAARRRGRRYGRCAPCCGRR